MPQACRIRSEIFRNNLIEEYGFPVSESRTCMCAIVVPTRCYSMAALAIAFGVYGTVGSISFVECEAATVAVAIVFPHL